MLFLALVRVKCLAARGEIEAKPAPNAPPFRSRHRYMRNETFAKRRIGGNDRCSAGALRESYHKSPTALDLANQNEHVRDVRTLWSP
jgi:hypothetical protein